MGTNTRIAVVKRSIPRGKKEELVEWMNENLMLEGAEVKDDNYFLTCYPRKFSRDTNKQKTGLAKKLKEIFEETKRSHWGEQDPQVFKAYEQATSFHTWDWRKELED